MSASLPAASIRGVFITRVGTERRMRTEWPNSPTGRLDNVSDWVPEWKRPFLDAWAAWRLCESAVEPHIEPPRRCGRPCWTYEGVRFNLAERGGPGRSMLGDVIMEGNVVMGHPVFGSFSRLDLAGDGAVAGSTVSTSAADETFI